MEFLIVLGVVAVILFISIGKTVWFWLALLVAALVLGYRAYRVRCKSCGLRVISGQEMKFCNQCGAEQKNVGGWRLRCESCRGLARSEFILNFCNRCGATIREKKGER